MNAVHFSGTSTGKTPAKWLESEVWKSSRGLYLAGVVGAGPPHEFPRTTELSILVTSVGVFILSPPPQPTQSMQTANNVKASLIVSP